ncbi:MAG: phosphate ABC transporter permease subunit PstC [Armatimonadota bacterium]|nr:phosphate ABC transporter permease subunit PstC [Armatimonadota bacterium]
MSLIHSSGSSGTQEPTRPGAQREAASDRRAFGDRVFRGLVTTCGVLLLALIVWIGLGLFFQTSLSRSAFGWSILRGRVWDPVREIYGALPYIYGTVVTSAVALFIAAPIGVGAAIFLSEVAPRWLAAPISYLVELLAAVPSVIFGLWGFLVICPWMQAHLNGWLVEHFGATPLFAPPSVLTNMLVAGVVLAAMVFPLISSVAREVIRTVPGAYREASLALGASRWETIRSVILPAAASGITGSIILAFGRAVGETMAVVMVIGNTPQISASLLHAGYTMPGLLANEFAEAYNDPMERSALLEIALILFVITFVINALARGLILLTSHRLAGRAEGPGAKKQLSVAWVLENGAACVGYLLCFALAGVLVIQFITDIRAHGIIGLFGPLEMVFLAVVAVRLATTFTAGTPYWMTWRRMNGYFMTAAVFLCSVTACLVLALLLFYVARQGAAALNINFFTQLPKSPDDPTGGMINGITGTLVLVGLAALIGIPVGVLSGIFLAEFGSTRLGAAVRFGADVLNGIASVVIGMFAYAAFVLPFKQFSALAGGAALGIMVIPIVARTTEEVLRLVPPSLREASLGLGATRSQTVWRVLLPVARGGVVTGIMLALARVSGETAPLLFTAFGNQQLSGRLDQPISSMTMMIYRNATSAYDTWITQAWAGALTLLVMVMIISLVARLATRNPFSR